KRPTCSHCKVFGHDIKKCKNESDQVNGPWKVDKKKQYDTMNQWKNKDGNMVRNNKWKVKDKVVEELRSTANKFSVLNTLPEDNEQEISILKGRMIVDKFLNEKVQPTLKEYITWTGDMINYFKDIWEENKSMDSNSGNGENDMEDVLEINNGTTKVMADNVIDGIKVCSVLETRLKSKKLQKSCDRVFQGWNWVSNMQECNKGCRIVVGWDSDTSIQVLHKTSQSIFCVVNAGNYKFKSFYTFVYAANERSERKSLWEELVREKGYVNGKPWCIAGDMNVTLMPNEHSCGSSVMTSDMAGIMTGILKKLDRVMTNEEFIEHFSNAHAKFLPYIIFDHTPSILSIPTSIKKVKAFRFSNYLTEKHEFLHIVRDKWNQEVHGNLFKRVESLRGQLQKVQSDIDKDPHNHNLRENEALLMKEFYEAERDEEKFLFQQAKIKWLSDGDKNSSYLHRVLKGRNNRSKILSLNDNAGNTYENDQIPPLFLKHFEDFLGNPQQGVIGADVCNAIREFLISGKMLGEINATLISLIPKVQTPSKVTDFRPIACCNVLYKCISKIITNRIKLVLGSLVSNNQSAFIPGRKIQDNILLTQEIMKGYNRKGGPKRVAFKIDLQKAYDTVSWKFLRKTLEEFGFHEKMVNWIMQCVTTAGFTLNVNGERIGYFKGGRGLRQGDPVSPYLFTLIMELFSLMLNRQIESDPKFQYHFGCKSMKMVHVCFADDLLVMCHGDSDYVKVIKKALDEFCSCSGLLPNNSKIRYLGVPLIAKRLSVKECGCLLDKIKNKVKNWKNKSLSYAGRLQLIAVVLESIHVYWASVFLLPITVINEINKLLKGFYGIRVIQLKVKWVHSVKLRNKSIWEVSADINDSWGWKILLTIRDLIVNNVKCIVGNGNDTSLWFDNWSVMGHLFKTLSYRDLYDARLKEDLNLRDMITNGQWNWPEEWYEKFPMITQIACPALNDVNTDKIVWRNRDGKDLKFSVSITYADMSIQYPIVPWWKLIWFSQCIPKHSFIVWLAVQDRLTNQDKLRK
ncbi:RNA-directed DNA polymerase, eukaryota, reverse transcriptase zinc-binding domain protein, partial [Tanacetum coccineum]